MRAAGLAPCEGVHSLSSWYAAVRGGVAPVGIIGDRRRRGSALYALDIEATAKGVARCEDGSSPNPGAKKKHISTWCVDIRFRSNEVPARKEKKMKAKDSF